MIWPFLASAAVAAANSPIEVPPEITQAWATYTHCVDNHFRQRMRSVHDFPEAQRAWTASVEDCRDVRATQLAIALRAKANPRIYGDLSQSRAIIIRAFDRFDAEFNMEWDNRSVDSTASEEPK
jgi:hypothetical protein